MKKRGEKTKDSIDKIPLKLNEETRRKTYHFAVCKGVKNLWNGTKKTVEEKWILIDWLTEGKDEALDQKLKHDIHIWGHEKYHSEVSDILITASLIGFFA